MKKITKKELNQRVKEIKEYCYKVDEKILYKDFNSDDFILCTIKTIDSVGNVWDYTFFNKYDVFGDILVKKYMYKCDVETLQCMYCKENL